MEKYLNRTTVFYGPMNNEKLTNIKSVLSQIDNHVRMVFVIESVDSIIRSPIIDDKYTKTFVHEPNDINMILGYQKKYIENNRSKIYTEECIANIAIVWDEDVVKYFKEWSNESPELKELFYNHRCYYITNIVSLDNETDLNIEFQRISNVYNGR
jgi:hypothetical protein